MKVYKQCIPRPTPVSLKTEWKPVQWYDMGRVTVGFDFSIYFKYCLNKRDLNSGKNPFRAKPELFFSAWLILLQNGIEIWELLEILCG